MTSVVTPVLTDSPDFITFDVERVKGAKNILFGEGLFFAKLTGPGKVWIQTMPISKLAEALIPFLPETNK